MTYTRSQSCVDLLTLDITLYARKYRVFLISQSENLRDIYLPRIIDTFSINAIDAPTTDAYTFQRRAQVKSKQAWKR